LLLPLDIAYRTGLRMISNHVLMDLTVICNEGGLEPGVEAREKYYTTSSQGFDKNGS
jgi:hypothetical protein